MMLTSLPNEIILYIASFLSDEDYIGLSNTNSMLLSLLPPNKQKLVLGTCYSVTKNSLEAFLVATSTSGFISVLDLSDCYWLDAIFLSNIILRVSYSIKSLFIHGTKLNSFHVAEILKGSPFMSELSLTFNNTDCSFWVEKLQEDEDLFESKINLNSCIFFKLKENLSKLTSVALHGDCLLMFTSFLCFCTNLQCLHLEISSSCKVSLEQSLKVNQQLRSLRRFLPPCNELRQLTCKIHNEKEIPDLLSPFMNNILSRKPFQFEALWVPNLSVGQYENVLKPSAKALQTIAFADSMYNLNQVSCLKTYMQQFLRKFVSNFPLLEMVSFRYDPEFFLEFCSLHREILVLQLQNFFPNDCEPGSELSQGLAYFTKLIKVSISTKFFMDHEDYGFHSPINELLKNCILLDEIEVGVQTSSALDRDGRVPTYSAKCSSLSLFSGFKKLKKLTLANLKLDALDFISMILVSCASLKSLRLTKVVNNQSNHTLTADVINQLKRGLSSAKNLEDFRWELGDDETPATSNINTRDSTVRSMQIGPELIVALQLCESLRRFAIFTDETVTVDLLSENFNWKSLILACIISPKISWNASKFPITSSHPAFQCYLGTSVTEARSTLPAVHFNEMILFESQVLKLPL